MTLDVTLAEAVPAPQASTPAPQASTPAPQVSTPAPQASTPRPKPPTATAQEAESGAPNAGNQRPVTPAAEPGTAVQPTLGFQVKDSGADGFGGEATVIKGLDTQRRPWRFEFTL